MPDLHGTGVAYAPDTSVERPREWRDDAACVGADPELFFPVGRAPALVEPGKQVCRRCPVVRDCLAYALLNDVAGVWGGTTKDERDALRTRHGIVAHPVLIALPSDDRTDEITQLSGGGARRRRSPSSSASPHGPCNATAPGRAGGRS